MEKLFGASWRTSVAGICGILGLIFNAAKAQLDGDPTTDPQWMVVLPAAVTSLGVIFARDNKVSSEDAGAKPSA